jgi:hypothetical protein
VVLVDGVVVVPEVEVGSVVVVACAVVVPPWAG